MNRKLELDTNNFDRVKELLYQAAVLKLFTLEGESNSPTRKRQSIFVESVETAIQLLPLLDQLLLTTRYFNSEAPYLLDADVYKKIGIGATHYQKIRDRALKSIGSAIHQTKKEEVQ